MQRFENRVVILTGAGSGIGAATARRFAPESTAIVPVGRTESKIRKVAADISNARAVTADICTTEVANVIIEAALSLGSIDVLVHDAGIVVERCAVEFYQALALDGAKHGVRVNAVNPAFTASELTEDMMSDEDLIAKFHERRPLGALADPEAIAAVIAFLTSDDARFVTGVNLPIYGG